jgi:hypothetical protein
MDMQLTQNEGIVIDESHHIPHGVWSSVAERLTVNQVRAGSNPVTPPRRIRLRSCQLEALESFTQLAGGSSASERHYGSPVVAQLVERQAEDLRVTGSIPVRGTKRKPKM